MENPTLPPPKEFYSSSVGHALGGFQLLEEGLKNYIGLHHETVRALVAGRVHFDYRKSDFQDAALGRLLTIFSKVCSNRKLVEDIRRLVKHRDHAAHQAFTRLYGGDTSDAEFVKMAEENLHLGTELAAIHQQLHEEMKNVLAVFKQLVDARNAG